MENHIQNSKSNHWTWSVEWSLRVESLELRLELGKGDSRVCGLIGAKREITHIGACVDVSLLPPLLIILSISPWMVGMVESPGDDSLSLLGMPLIKASGVRSLVNMIFDIGCTSFFIFIFGGNATCVTGFLIIFERPHL